MQLRVAVPAIARLFLPCLLLAAAFTIALLMLTDAPAAADSAEAPRRGGPSEGSSAQPVDTGSAERDSRPEGSSGRVGRDIARRVPLPSEIPHGAEDAPSAAEDVADDAAEVAQRADDEADRTLARVEGRAIDAVRDAESTLTQMPVTGDVTRRLGAADRVDSVLRQLHDAAPAEQVPTVDVLPPPPAGPAPAQHELGVSGAAHHLRDLGSTSALAPVEARAPYHSVVAPSRSGDGAPTDGPSDPSIVLPGAGAPAAGGAGGSVSGPAPARLTESGVRIDICPLATVAAQLRSNPPHGPAYSPGFAPD